MRVRHYLAVSMSILCLIALKAADLNPLPEQFLLLPAPADLVIDGNLAEWDLARAIDVDPERLPPEQLRSNDFNNPIGGPADISARVMLAWDNEHLYIAARVRDDHLMGIKPVAEHNIGPAGWACDSVMLQLNSYRQPLISNTPYSRVPFIALRYVVPENGRGQLLDNARGLLDKADQYWKLPRNSRHASRETEDGYEVEAALTWADLGFNPQAGEPLAISILLGDIDPDESLNQLGWRFPVDAERATFRLAHHEDALGLITLGSKELTAGSPQVIRYRVDAIGAPVKVVALRAEGPEGFSVSHGIDTEVPQGQRLEDVIPLGAMPAKPGIVTVTLDAVIDGTARAIVTDSFEILPPQPPPPLVVNPPGELRRMPPERTHHHAQEDRRLNKIPYSYIKDRSGYERYILTHVKSAVDGRVPGSLKAQGDKWAAEQVLRTLALYRLTGEQKHADWTRELIQSQLTWLRDQTSTDERLYRMRSLVWPRYFTWQNDPESTLAPADAEAQYTALWAEIAANPPEWLFQEWGYHNRCWHRWADCKLLLHFAEAAGKPADPRIAEYVAWHDEHLAGPYGDSTDNSAGYNWLHVNYLQQVYAATGQLDQLLEHPGHLDWAKRYRDYVSPGGIWANWGSTSGWGTGASGVISDMELFARLTGDGSFRYAAHRAAEYHYNHFWPDHDQYHGPKDAVANSFVFAWLIADDEVAPRAPTAGSTITWRHRVGLTSPEERNNRPGLDSWRFLDEEVPDKAMLKSGNDPYGLWAKVELLDLGGHSGLLPGALLTIMDQGSVLYAGQAYYELSPDFNNIVWVEDLEGAAADPRPTRVEVPTFVDDPAFTWLQVRTQRFSGLPITSTRDIILVKNGFIVVRDRLDFHATMKLRLGPNWQARNLGPQSGADWFNSYYDKLYHTGLGLGRGVQAWPNPAWDMMIAFAPRQDCLVSVQDRHDDNPWRVSPVQLRQAWTGIVQAGESRAFVSVLLPHTPIFDVTPIRGQLEFLVDTNESLLLRLPRLNNAKKPLEGNKITLQLHNGEGELTAEGWASDARMAFFEQNLNGTVRQSVMVDGQTLKAADEELSGKARKAAAESIYTLPEGE